MAYPIFLTITFVISAYGAVVIWVDRQNIAFMNPWYWKFLISPWKLSTFTLGVISINLLVYQSKIFRVTPVIDVYSTTFISLLTYIFAPWCVGFIYRYLRRGLYKEINSLKPWYLWKLLKPIDSAGNPIYRSSKHFFVAVSIWVFVTLVFYHLYIKVIYNPTDFWISGLVLQLFLIKSVLFLLAGLAWNLEYRESRGVTFSFLENDWFVTKRSSSFRKIRWVFYLICVPIIAMVLFRHSHIFSIDSVSQYQLNIGTPKGEYEIKYGDNPIKFVKKGPSKRRQDQGLTIPAIDFGNYYALVMGNNDYEYWPQLKTAVNDAKKIGSLLEKRFGYEVELLLNKNHKEMKNAIFRMREKLTKNDNLLIYYAGHGELDKAEGRGYWLPVDADTNLRAEWINNTFILDQVKATKAKHVIVVVDSCFSGSLTRGTTALSGTKELGKLVSKKTRIIITSGGNEPVADSGGEDNHSVFAYGFIKTLMEIRQATVSNSIFPKIREYVLNNANQTPEMSILTQAGHDGGDFIFVPD